MFYYNWLCYGLSALPFAAVCLLSLRREEDFKALDMGIAAVLFCACCGALCALAAVYFEPVAPLVFALLLYPGAALFSAMLSRRARDLMWCCPAAILCSLAVMLFSASGAEALSYYVESEILILRAIVCIPAGVVCVAVTVNISLRRALASNSAESWNGLAPAMLALSAMELLAVRSAAPVWQAAVATVALAGCCFIYRGWGRLVIAARRISEVQRRDAELEGIISMQRERYSALEEEIAMARAARHDLRHHISAIRQYVESGDMEALGDYLDQFGSAAPDVSLTWCGNRALDSVAQHYLGQARAEGIELDTVIDVGEDAGIPAPDLCIVLGNSLENSLEAARRAPRGKRFIRVRAESTPGWVAVVIGNGYAARPLTAVGDGYLSSKQEGRVGVGLSSIRAVAEKYDGEARFEAAEDMFKTSVILFKDAEAAGKE